MLADTDPLADLAAGSTDLTQALAELRGDGLRETEGRDVLRDAEVPSEVLDQFLSLAVREVSGPVLFGLALSLPMCIAWRGAGTEALDYCLASGDLDDTEREFVFERMAHLEVPGESVATRHARVVAASVAMDNFRTYQAFLQKNTDDVLAQCRTEFDTLVLDPAFPPTNYRLDCLILAVNRASDPTPYQHKIVQWVTSGDLESDGLTLEVFYSYLSDYLQDPRYAELRSATYARIVTLLRDPGATSVVWAHLSALVGRRFAGADELQSALRAAGITLNEEQRTVLEYPLKALGALANGGAAFGNTFDHWYGLVLDNRPPVRAE